MSPNVMLVTERQRELVTLSADRCCGSPRAPRPGRVAKLRLPRLTSHRPPLA